MDKKEFEADNVAQTKLLNDDDYHGTVYKPTTIDGPLASEDECSGSSGFLYVSAFIVNLLAFSAGICFSWSSPVISKLSDKDTTPLSSPITQNEASWIAGILSLGAAVGPWIAGKLADTIGRKNTLLCIALPMTLSFLILGYSSDVRMYYAARFIKGLSVGAAFTVLPMYLGEISEDKNRGTIGCLMGVLISFGLLFSFVVGPELSVKLFCFACTFSLIAFFFLFYIFIPESPIYLASKGNRTGAQEALMKLRSRKAYEVQRELSEIMKSLDDANSSQGIKDLFISPGLRRAFIICSGLLILQQLSGINAVLSYMQTIFEAGGGSIPASLATVIIGVIQSIATIATSAVVEKLGRKLLVLLSVVGSTISLIMLGTFFYLQINKYDISNLSFLPVASLIAYVIFFNLGIGPLPWAILGEMFPSNVKSIASTLNSSICFLASFLITLLFPILTVSLGMAETFWLFGACCIGGTVFVLAVVPETKGKTLLEIQEMLNK